MTSLYDQRINYKGKNVYFTSKILMWFYVVKEHEFIILEKRNSCLLV